MYAVQLNGILAINVTYIMQSIHFMIYNKSIFYPLFKSKVDEIIYSLISVKAAAALVDKIPVLFDRCLERCLHLWLDTLFTSFLYDIHYL